MDNHRKLIGERIKAACDISGVSLKKACALAKVKYNTTFNQIRLGRDVPATTVGEISAALGVPLNFFFPQGEITQNAPEGKDARLARKVNWQRAKVTRAGFEVTTDHILDWYREEGARLRNWQWFADQVDLYNPLEVCDRLMRPISFGTNSITMERLLLSSKEDYYQTVGAMSQSRLDHAMQSHKAAQCVGFVVSDEEINEVIKGQKVVAGYRKITMRVQDDNDQPVTAVFSKLTWLRG
ncbi:helix-turn-helix domain-containing protein [Phaeobacter sp. C3_T13_0]|uniref:helix-turn-helix domain-containing protein n=1 Tax=Phaeobacter cretensis TaxID=3342641 RepID=UPI0039BCAF9A